MAAREMRTLGVVAGAAWLVVAGSGLGWLTVDSDTWELPYMIYSLALLVAVAATVGLAAVASRGSGRPRLRMVGLALCGLGLAASIVAWALPLWMTILGVGLTTVAVASAPRPHRGLVVLGAAQLAGLSVMFAALLAEVGPRDEWGDHPAAGALGVWVTVAVTIAGLVLLARSPGPLEVAPGRVALAGLTVRE